MYVKVTNGTVDQYPYTVGQLRHDNPNTSFPKFIPDATLEAYGLFPVHHADTPSYNAKTEYVVTSSTPELVDGHWTVSKTVTAKTQDQITADTNVKAASVRAQRDDLLASTDWWAVSDRTMTSEQTTYRQALRDITGHANFPYLEDADWPVKP